MFYLTKKLRRPTLFEVLDKQIISDDGHPLHLLLEGDNLLSLRYLQNEYQEKIDLIFADPPQVKEPQFKTADSFGSENLLSIFPITDDFNNQLISWLCFLEKRIALAHFLLKPDGCFFLSISNREVAEVKLLCDHIFSAENYITTLTIKTGHESKIVHDRSDIHNITELILFYRKSDCYKPNRLYKDAKEISDYIYEIKTNTSNPQTIEIENKRVEMYRPGEYTISKKEPHENHLKKISIRGTICDGNNSGRFFEQYLKNIPDMDILYKVPDMGNDTLNYRYFQNRKSAKFKNGFYFQGMPVQNYQNQPPPFPNFFNFEKEFEQVCHEGGISFPYGKKPVKLMKLLLNIGIIAKDSIILDLFSGSGSLAHAAIELNQKDQLNRKVILCNSSEEHIPEKITYPRLKNVIQGYTLTYTEKIELYSAFLFPEMIRKRNKILNDHFAEIRDKNQSHFEKIVEEIEDQQYKIYGLNSKGCKVKGLGNSLQYFKVIPSEQQKMIMELL